MSITVPHPQNIVPPRSAPAVRCMRAGCDGEVLRHSLDCGLSDYRCTRCFARYTLGGLGAGAHEEPRRLRPFLDDRSIGREED